MVTINQDFTNYEYTQENIDALADNNVKLTKESLSGAEVVAGDSCKSVKIFAVGINGATLTAFWLTTNASGKKSNYDSNGFNTFSKSHSSYSYYGFGFTVTPPPVEVEGNYELTQNDITSLNDANVSLEVGGVVASAGLELGQSELVFTASGDYIITNAFATYSEEGMDKWGDPAIVQENTDFLLSANSKVATGALLDKVYDSITIETVLVETPIYELTQNDMDALTNAGLSLEVGGVPAYAGLDLGQSELVFTASGDYIITNAFATYSEEGMDKWGDPIIVQENTTFQLSTNSKVATGSLLDKVYDSITIETIETVEPPVDNKDGFNNVYSVTDTDVFNVLENSQTIVNIGETPTIIDGRTYIQTLYNLPFEISSSLIGDKKNVYLGERDTGVIADTIENRFIYVDGGIITVPNVGDLTDFTNKKVILHLPFFNPIDLDVVDVVGETVSLSYKINVYTGDCTVYITSSKTGGEVATVSGSIALEIPYKTAFIAEGAIKYGADSSLVINDLKTAYIEIYDSTDTKNLNSLFLTPVLDNGDLNGVTGFVVVNDVDLKIAKIRSEELNRIENILKSGVIIK